MTHAMSPFPFVALALTTDTSDDDVNDVIDVTSELTGCFARYVVCQTLAMNSVNLETIASDRGLITLPAMTAVAAVPHPQQQSQQQLKKMVTCLRHVSCV